MAHTFSNGSEYDYYMARNCERCRKAGDPGAAGSSSCEMFEAIHDAATTDGYIPLALAERAGLRTFQCQELEP